MQPLYREFLQVFDFGTIRILVMLSYFTRYLYHPSKSDRVIKRDKKATLERSINSRELRFFLRACPFPCGSLHARNMSLYAKRCTAASVATRRTAHQDTTLMTYMAHVL